MIIRYKENFMNIAEVYGDDPEQRSITHVDIIANFQFVELREAERRKTLYKCFKTLYLDLTQGEETLFANIHRSTRNEIRRAAKENFQYVLSAQPTSEEVEEFCSFFDRFAKQVQITPVRRAKLGAFLAEHSLVLTYIRDEQGQILCYHAYIADGERISSLYSASHREAGDNARNRAISRANKYLKWMNIKRFKEMGYHLYDFGGIFLETNTEKQQNVNLFKLAYGGREVLEYKSYQAVTWRGRLGLLYLKWKWKHSPEFIKLVW